MQRGGDVFVPSALRNHGRGGGGCGQFEHHSKVS